MKKITRSLVNLSDIPEEFHSNELIVGHRLYTYAEFHIDNDEKDDLTLWLRKKYPTINRKNSFLIYIDK